MDKNNILLDQETRKNMSVDELTRDLNGKLEMLNSDIDEKELASLHSIIASEIDIFNNTFANKKYSFANMSNTMRKFIADNIEFTDTKIDKINIAMDAIDFWNGNELSMGRNVFDYTNKCLVNATYKGYSDFKIVNDILDVLSDANKEFAKDAVYYDYLSKSLKKLKEKISNWMAD